MPQEHASTGTPKLVIGSVALLLLLAALDQTIVATALPTIVAEFGALEKMSWVVTAYILASTVSAPLYGKLGDLYGRRLMVYFSVGLFLAGSLLCSLAFSMEALIYARALQGLGGGGLFVLALAVIGDVIPPRERGKIQGVFAAIFSTSSIIGPLLGGWFVQNLSWHWIFLINVPFGILAVIGFTMGFAPRGDRVKHAIDWLGAVTLTLALASLTLFSSLGAYGVGIAGHGHCIDRCFYLGRTARRRTDFAPAFVSRKRVYHHIHHQLCCGGGNVGIGYIFADLSANCFGPIANHIGINVGPADLGHYHQFNLCRAIHVADGTL